MMLHRIFLSRLACKNALHISQSLLHCGNVIGTMSEATVQNLQGNEIEDDVYVPTPTWPPEAVQLYNKLKEETSHGDWEKYCKPSQEGLDKRSFLRATGEKMFSGALFLSKSERMLKGVMVFGPWVQGGLDHVHGGAISTVHDSIAGTLANLSIGACVTGNLNTSFRRGVPLGATTFVTVKIDDVSGRKINLTSKIMSADESVLYSDATSLFILLRSDVEK